MKKSTAITIVAIGIAVSLGIIILVSQPKKEATTVTIGHLPIVGDLPVFVAYEQNFFKDEGLDVQLIEMHSGNEAINALVTGRTQMHGTVGCSSLFTIQAKSPGKLKVIMSTEETEDKFGASIIVRNDLTLRSLRELKGKKLGTYSGLTHLLTAKLILQRFMDPETDIEIVQVEPRLQIQALAAKQFDCLLSIEPYPTIAIEKGVGRVLEPNVRSRFIVSPFWAAGTVVSTQFAQENPDICRKLIWAMGKAVDFIEEHEREARQCIPKYTPLSETIAAKVRLYQWSKLGEEDRSAAQELADKYFEAGLVQSKLKVDDMFFK